MRLLGNRIIVKQDDAFDQTATGIFIPSVAQEKQTKGKVLHVGTGTIYDKNQIFEEGQDVIFQKGRGYEMELDGDTVLMLDEREVLMIL